MGFGIIDLELKPKAPKASWVKRLSEQCLINEVINADLKMVTLHSNYILTTSEKK